MVKVLIFTIRGMFEPRVNEISDELLALVDAELHGPQPELQASASRGATQVDPYNENDRTNEGLTLCSPHMDVREVFVTVCDLSQVVAH